MSLRVGGAGVSKGIAIGSLRRVMPHLPEVVRRELDGPTEEEVNRFRRALRRLRSRLRAARRQLPKDTPKDLSSFIDAHVLILEDRAFSRPVVELIRQERCNAEWALKLHRDHLLESFEQIEDPYLRTRRDDIDHVVERLVRVLLEVEEGDQAPSASRRDQTIAVAADVTPDELAMLHRQGVKGVITEKGGRLSHTAIAARSLGIPAVAAAGGALRLLQDAEIVVIDGSSGLVLGTPDRRSLTYFRKQQRDAQRRRRARQKAPAGPSRTRDGERVVLDVNIERARDIRTALKADAEGVGLYRTESLFLDAEHPPTEDAQFQVYRRLVRAMKGAPVTIRTLDLWAHARIVGLEEPPTEPGQPALGLRAIRLCLQYPEIFEPQLRALLRASSYGPIRVLLPMVSNLHEVRQVRAMLDRMREELTEEGARSGEPVQLGIMVEIPATAISAHLFARQVDFMAIGTNDLIQYALAIDRDDDAVQHLYDPLHPSVLRLIASAVKGARSARIPVTLCGEMAGDPMFTRLLLGLGLRQLSMHPSSLAEVKRILRDTDTKDAARMVKRLLRSTDADRSRMLLDRLNEGLELD